jgi:arylsulfatase A-like enzyme
VSSLDILPTALAAAGDSAKAEATLDGINLLPLLKGETKPQSRDFFWCSGSDEGWWAVRSGDWKLVGEKGTISLFDLSKDVSESNDLAKQIPEKVAELMKLHDAWLAEMANPVKVGEKRYNMAPQTEKKPNKLTKEEKKKARDMERAKKRQPTTPAETPEAPKP